MKVFLLIHEQDTDAAWGANVDPFISLEAAQAAMQKSYEDSIKSWDFVTTEQTDEHYSECLEKSAVLRDDSDVEKWRIEEKELDVQVAIEVEGGVVQTIYTNADNLYPDVFDLDTSDFSTETEEREVDVLKRELNEMVNAPGWRVVG